MANRRYPIFGDRGHRTMAAAYPVEYWHHLPLAVIYRRQWSG